MRLLAWLLAVLLWTALSGSVASAQAAPPDLRKLRDTVGPILDAGVRDPTRARTGIFQVRVDLADAVVTLSRD